MNLAILFWFYKDLEISRNRLKLLRHYNPDAPIFGLYGGGKDEAEVFESQLSSYLDDFFAFSDDRSSEWKWINGDLMIADWYSQRGRVLSWDSIVVVQWDMLVFGPLTETFKELKEGEMLLSSLRPVTEVINWWYWTTQEPGAQRYTEFVKYIHDKFDYNDSPLCCQFVVVALPREFLERYITVEEPELGFIEYRVPTYARMFGIPFCQTKAFECWWSHEPATADTRYCDIALTAAGPVSFGAICRHLLRRDGARVFHPFYKIFPLGVGSAKRFLIDTLKARGYLGQVENIVSRYYLKVRGMLQH